MTRFGRRSGPAPVRAAQRRLSAMPASMQASLDPVVEQPGRLRRRRRVPQVGEDRDAAPLELGGLRVLVLVDHVLVDALGHQLRGLRLHPRRDERGQVQPRAAVEQQLVVDQLVGDPGGTGPSARRSCGGDDHRAEGRDSPRRRSGFASVGPDVVRERVGQGRRRPGGVPWRDAMARAQHSRHEVGRGSRCPDSARVRSRSASRPRSTCRTPSVAAERRARRPRAGRPAPRGRPRARALTMSAPVRMPESNSTSTRSPTASAIAGQRVERADRAVDLAAAVVGHQRCPSTPASTARARVVDVLDALERDRAVPVLAQEREVVPGVVGAGEHRQPAHQRRPAGRRPAASPGRAGTPGR